MAIVRFDQGINRHIIILNGAESRTFQQGEEYNSVISVQVSGGGSLAVCVEGHEISPLRVVTTNDSFGCKAPNLNFVLTGGTATILIDRKRVRQD